MATEEITGAKYERRCETKVKKVEIEYKWTICDFIQTFKEMGGMSASSFMIKDCPLIGSISINRARINCMPSATHADIDITLKKTDGTLLLAHVKCSVINSQGIKRLIFANDTVKAGFYDIKYSHQFSVNDLIPDLVDDALTMSFDFMVKMVTSAYSIIHTSPAIELPVPMPESSSAYNFKKLLEDPKFSDVTITVGSKKFNAHRVVLANRSSVFAAMFEHKMEENESSNVDITDMSEEAVEEMLKFIYTDETEKLEDMTNELLDAAEKYDLQTLKDLCVYTLRKNLNCSNAAESLILADRYNLKETKVGILKFISKQRNSLEDTDGYKALREKYPLLLLETFEIK